MKQGKDTKYPQLLLHYYWGQNQIRFSASELNEGWPSSGAAVTRMTHDGPELPG